jgi:hypothetical protein
MCSSNKRLYKWLHEAPNQVKQQLEIVVQQEAKNIKFLPNNVLSKAIN